MIHKNKTECRFKTTYRFISTSPPRPLSIRQGRGATCQLRRPARQQLCARPSSFDPATIPFMPPRCVGFLQCGV